MIAEYVTYVMVAVLLVAMVLEVRTGRIPNWLTLLPVALFIVLIAMAEDRWALMPQLYLAIGVFIFGVILFAVAGIGAGSVKLMTGVALFVPLSEAFPTFLIFVISLFIVAGIVVQVRKVVGSDDSKWHIWRKPVLPMSLPIGIAGLASLVGLG